MTTSPDLEIFRLAIKQRSSSGMRHPQQCFSVVLDTREGNEYMATNRWVQRIATVVVGALVRSVVNAATREVGKRLSGSRLNSTSSRGAKRSTVAGNRARSARPRSTQGHNSTMSDVISYEANDQNNRPDPGEVVWTWVAYEDDPSQGKDRPVLLIGEPTEGEFYALQLTSKDHDRDAEQEERAGRLWMDIGTGAWDRQGRPSEVRLNRLLTVAEADIRREGHSLDRAIFEEVVAEAQRVNDWK